MIQEFINNYSDFKSITLIISTLIFSILVFKFLYKRFHNKFSDKKYIFQKALILSINTPFFLSLYLFSFYYILKSFEESFDKHFLVYFKQAPQIIIFTSFTIFIFSFINNLQRVLVSRNRKDKQLISSIDIIFKLVRITVIIITLLIILTKIGLNIEALLAFGGVGGLVVGFAAKDIVASFFSTFMIYFDNPFKVGDWINIYNNNIEGTVDEIGWRYTTVISLNRIPLYVPNSILNSSVIENKTRMSNRRFREYIGIRYDDMSKVVKITSEIEDIIQTNSCIDQSQTNYVHLDSFGDFSVNIVINFLTFETQYIEFAKIKQKLFLQFAEVITRNGAEIAFPTNLTYIQKLS